MRLPFTRIPEPLPIRPIVRPTHRLELRMGDGERRSCSAILSPMGSGRAWLGIGDTIRDAIEDLRAQGAHPQNPPSHHLPLD